MSIPAGPRLRPYVACSDARAAIAFYRDVFGMELEMCLEMSDGRIGHAELKLPDLWLYVADTFPEMGVRSPTDLGGTAVSLSMYVEDVDDVFARAVAAGARAEREPNDAFYGDRVAVVIDPAGHRWMLHTQREALSTAEVVRRFQTTQGG